MFFEIHRSKVNFQRWTCLFNFIICVAIIVIYYSLKYIEQKWTYKDEHLFI